MTFRFASLAPWIACPWIGIAPLLVGCSGGVPGPEVTSTTASAIYGGVIDDDSQQNASVVAIEIGDGTTFTLCSGTLVGPKVVLTARHCVSALTTTAAAELACDDNGNSTNGPDFGDDQPVATVHVFVGPSIYQGEVPSATATAFYHPSGTTLCNGDVALITLDTAITSVPSMRVRLSSAVTTGESVRAVGFGENDQNKPIGTRFRKDDIAVLAVGSTVSPSLTPLGSNEFELGESTCEGDSGGPAIDETSGAVVGVVSRGGSDCTQNYGHVYESLEGFLPVFQAAFAAAGGTWVDEDGSTGSGEGGTPAAGDAGNSGGGSSSGSDDTSSSGAGPYQGGVNLHAGQGSGCAATGAPGGGSPAGFGAFALAMLGLVLARRRVR
jgi:MYXO-CTERM domain-containing protein